MIGDAAGTCMFGEREDKAKKAMENKEKRAGRGNNPRVEHHPPHRESRLHASPKCQQTQVPRTRPARVRMEDHRAKVARKEDQIAEREHQVDQVRRQKA